ncbi:processing peptidase [Planococcus antarcticus DSM 14505]|uniref:Peptidase M16 n=1 Tax=Planococcus antarcticus DSM 14505 TaxID=1185653 RepID=A0A1C7DGD1_9BACL|nr:pitrilysin family protein [Planococcus antarcticus]ANU10566.1 peptidase M16 [Planococcus antarcticus DSM 14505]EIM08359.1 processing peptidase [Planococcus antarcticus DSM 14505]
MVITQTCKNGLRIVSEHIPHFHSVAMGVFVNNGSRDELSEENGITHFIEHMLFKGTDSRTAKEIAREFDRIGGDINAYTSKEYTCYYAKILDHHAEHAVTVLADMLFNSQMDPVEFDKERQVILEEISMTEDMPDDDVHEQLWRVMYPQNSIGAPILGTSETLASFTPEKIRNYMDCHYTPANIVVSVAGNITPALLEKVEALFGDFEKEENPKKYEFPLFAPGYSLKNKETEQGHLCLGFPGLALNDPDIYNVTVLNNIIGGSMSSRLFQEIREQRGLAYSIFSYHSAYSDHGTLAIYGGTSDEQMTEMQEVIMRLLKELKNGGITQQEITDSKEQLKGSLMLGLESTSARMSRNGRHELLLGTHQSYDEVLEQIDQVSFQKVMELLEILVESPAVSIIRPKEASLV